jgi:hypothetical protein
MSRGHPVPTQLTAGDDSGLLDREAAALRGMALELVSGRALLDSRIVRARLQFAEQLDSASFGLETVREARYTKTTG